MQISLKLEKAGVTVYEGIHDVDILLDGIHLKARIIGFLLANRGNRFAFVIMRRIDKAVVRKRKNLIANAAPHFMHVTGLRRLERIR